VSLPTTSSFQTIGEVRRATYALLAAVCREREAGQAVSDENDHFAIERLVEEVADRPLNDYALLMEQHVGNRVDLVLMLTVALGGWADFMWEIYNEFDGTKSPSEAAGVLIQRLAERGF
jgi:hypothetical protein